MGEHLDPVGQEGNATMLIGYARVSTTGQDAGFEAQLRELKAAGAGRIFQEKVSSIAEREQLEAALDIARPATCSLVTRLDRLARSVGNFVEIAARVEAKGASLKVLNLNLETASPTGRLMMNLLASIAQFEREILIERQREGHRQGQGRRQVQGPEADRARQARRDDGPEGGRRRRRRNRSPARDRPRERLSGARRGLGSERVTATG